MNKQSTILPLIVMAQFCCTSLWFAGNAVMDELVRDFGLATTDAGLLTSGIQLGFIIGTLVYAILSVADRYSPSRVFLFSALIAAGVNFASTVGDGTLIFLLTSRVLTGFFLAGIYPVGMKIAADYYDKGLGKSLGYLVGALVLGTAFPHLLNGLSFDLSWRSVLRITSALAIFGGLLVGLLVPDGPFRRYGQRPEFSSFLQVFKHVPFRRAAVGYFGHMWELYAFWTFVPLLLSLRAQTGLHLSGWSFAIIAAGSLGCVSGGYLSRRFGVGRMARFFLAASGACCLLFPLCFYEVSLNFYFIYLLFWGFTVVADSPLFSTLVAQRADPELKGTALTVVNCVGFAITIVSIQLLRWLWDFYPPEYIVPLLAISPVMGVWSIWERPKSVTDEPLR